MIKLETYVNEKLRVTKSSAVPDLIALVGSKNRKDFESRFKQIAEYLKYDSDLPIVEMEYRNNVIKNISKNMKTDMIYF